jgi:hypothetical protein
MQARDGTWFGVTLRSIVQKDGDCGLTNPNSPSAVGVDVWMHEYTDPENRPTSVSTDDSLFRDLGKLGTVSSEPNATLAMIKIDKSVADSEAFQNKGVWYMG